MKGKYSASLAFFALVAFLIVPSYAFASGIGSSNIQLTQNSANLSVGGSASVGYTVRLVSGTPWGTTLNIVNKNQLLADGITLTLSNSYGDPTYSGTMGISASSNATPGTYSIILNATGDDPSSSNTALSLTIFSKTSNTTTATTTISQAPAVFTLFNASTLSINATKGGFLSVKSFDGVAVNATIPANTFANMSGTLLSRYNFTLAIFEVSNLALPPNESGYNMAYAFAYEVNGKITPTISLVNKLGKAQPVITTAAYPSTWGSWTYFGGNLSANGTAYTGGAYKFKDAWTYNATSKEILNDQFFKPVLWVFTFAPTTNVSSTTVPSTVTTAPTTTPYTAPSASKPPYAAIAVVVIIIVLIAAFFAFRKK